MEHQEIDLQGKFWIERVASAPAWEAAFEGRMFYAENLDRLLLGTSTGWLVQAGHASLYDLGLYARKASTNSWSTNQLPNNTTTHDLGSTSKRWDYVYAVTFDGTATTATYADLAEKYTAPNEYEIGSIVEVSELTGYDITIAETNSEHIVGVISANPGFTMNNSSLGLAVGLVGRVPIRIIGPVKKRDFIVCNGAGVGIVAPKHLFSMAIALETNDSPDEKLVECLLKV